MYRRVVTRPGGPTQVPHTQAATVATAGEDAMPGQENANLLRHFMLKTIILPRQAWDKHSESTHKKRCFLAGWRLIEGRDHDDAWHAKMTTSVHRVPFPASWDYDAGTPAAAVSADRADVAGAGAAGVSAGSSRGRGARL